MNNNGWIKIHRQIIDWEWYSDIPTCRLFLHLLLTANHKAKKWQGKTINEGELITSIGLLSKQTGLTIKQVRTALSKLESTGEIIKKGANKYTLIQVQNYAVYQAYDLPEGQTKGKQRANKGQTKGKQRANKGQTKGNKQEYKECKNDKNYIITSERTHTHEDDAVLSAEGQKEPALINCPDVLMTEQQQEKLLEILSLAEFDNYVENLQEYIDNGHKVHNCYQTILEWTRRDRKC